MDIQSIQQIVEYIKSLADPLVTSGYQLALRQVQFQMIFDIIMMFIMGGMFYSGLKFIQKGKKEQNRDSCSMYEIWYAIGVIQLVISPIVFLCNLSYIINAIINPDWVAIQMIIRLMK